MIQRLVAAKLNQCGDADGIHGHTQDVAVLVLIGAYICEIGAILVPTKCAALYRGLDLAYANDIILHPRRH